VAVLFRPSPTRPVPWTCWCRRAWAGLVCALATGRLLTGLLFGVGPFDAATYAVVSALLVLVAMLACAIPAALLAVAAACAMLAACAGDVGDGEAGLPGDTDPAGVRLEDYGLTEAPCGQDLHLATVVTSKRGYHAFCADERGNTSVLIVSPQGAEVDAGRSSPLETSLAITPSDVAVPELLGTTSLAPGRRVTSETVAYVHPGARGPVQDNLRGDVALASSCSSQATFESAQCSVIENWIDNDDFFQTHSWCSSGLLAGDAQRTSSAQGVTFPWEGRIRVAGCNEDVLVRRYYKNPFSGAWWNAGNFTLQPGHILSWIVSSNDATWCPGGLDPCQHASDLRFRVEPTAGATYRYTGGFMNFPAVP
jgi:hypothetical protein